jgi:uncharacterized protein
MELSLFFEEYPEVAVAFSGGVDSSYLLYAAQKYARKVCAYYVKTVFQPQFEYDDAKRITEQLGIGMVTIDADILGNSTVVSNPSDRCYYCKQTIFTAIIKRARDDGFFYVLDGTNASDDEGDRPGMRALREMKVLSPLKLCGLSKSDVRSLSKEAGLFTWDKPSYACLATRIMTGQRIDERIIKRCDDSEEYMRTLGFSDFRVRTRGEDAVIQIKGEQIPILIANRENILNKLGGMYRSVLFDLKTRDEQ